MNSDLKQLRIFAAVARCGNFTRAAERLHLSQPSLSMHIRELEGALGVRLLDRSTRSVSLTSAGRDFLPTAERLIEDFERALQSVTDLAARRRGRVSVAALPSVAAELLPRAIAALRAQHPEIVVSLRDDVADNIIAQVASGDVDFGIGPVGTGDADVARTALVQDHMVAVFPCDHPLSTAAKTSWRAIAKCPFIAMSRDSSVRLLTDQAFAHNAITKSPAFEVKYMSTAIGMIGQGLGVGALPSSALLMVEQAGLRHASLGAPVMRRQIDILSARGRSFSPAAAALISILRALAKS